MKNETKYWAAFVTGSAERIVRRQLSQRQLDAIRENVVICDVKFGPEPMPEPDPTKQ